MSPSSLPPLQRAVGTTTDSKGNKLSLCKEDQNASLWCPLEWGELLPLLVGSTLSKRLKPTMEPSLTRPVSRAPLNLTVDRLQIKSQSGDRGQASTMR